MALTVNTNIVNDGDKYLLDAKNVKGTFSVISSFDDLKHPTEHTLYPTQIVGSLVYNTTDSKFYKYNGSTWVEVFTKVDTDTTYESKAAASGGTTVSLVTTGEKYIWNNKSDFSGNYNDLSNKPTIPTNSDYVDLTTTQEIDGRKDFIVNPRVKIDHIFHNLPEAYQELDYLESTGTQYINTGIYLTQDHSVEVDYQLTSTSQSRRGIFGQVETGLVNRYGVLLTASGNKTEYGYGSTNVYYQGSTLDLNRHKIKQEQNKLCVDGTLIHTFATTTFTSTVNAPLGSFNYSNYTPALAKYYESKWWNNTTLIRDFIPCYRKADNKPGFYDIVNNEFYVNAGTDEFTIGNALIPYTSYENLITADNLATVAFSGDYADLDNTPIIPTVNNATLTVTQNGTTKGTFTANSNTNTTIALTDTTYESKAAVSGGTAVSLVTTGEKYIWNNKQDALTIDNAVSLSSSNPVQNKAIGNYIAARGEHLLTNGFANLKNNYNFTTFDYDGSDTYYANGCFKKMGWGAYATYTNDESIPVDVNMTYRFDFYTKTNHSGAQVNGYIRAYDIDGNEIGSYQVAPRANTLTTLAQDLKNGDTKIYLTDMSHWQSTNLGTNNASVLIWGYKNSYGYTYPPDTYTRYRYTSLWSQASQMDYANNCITLTSAWNKGPFTAGTPISQGQDGSGALYCNIDDVAITCTLKTDSDSSTQAMNGWEHHWYHINGVQNKNTFATSQFPFGTAFVKVGLMNRVSQTSSEYFKLSTMSFTTSAASVDQFKIPSSTGSYNYDYPILFKNHKNTNTEVANTSFATTLTYNPHSKALKINGTTISPTDNKTTQTATSTAGSYPVLFKNAASNTTETAGVNFDSDGTTNFYYNPSTNTLQATNITAMTLNGKTLGNDPKFTDTDTNQTIKTKNSSSTDVTFSSDAAVELVAGSNITITPDSTNNTITITSTAAGEDTNQTIKVGNVTFGNNDVVELVGGGDTTVVGNATNKTITISSTASVTPGNGTLTLNRNNELGNSKIEVGTFTANQSTNTSLDISDLYYCTYSATGEGTTVADVDAALALNKIPVCWFSNRLYVYHGINGDYRYFSCVTDRAAYIIRLMANSSNENYNKWSNNYDNFEFQYFKRSSTAGWGNGTLANISDSFYPSEKLVYESLQGVPTVYVVSKTTNSVFNSSNDAITISSAITDIEGNSIALADFKLGNTIYVTETDVPDRWVGKITKSGSTVTSVILFKLETAKVPITDIKIGVSGSEASCVDNSIAKLVTNSAYDASTNPLATMADITTIPTNLVTTNTDQTITGTKTFTVSQKFQSGNPNGCAIFGADSGTTTLTNGVRKLGRLTSSCAEDITKTVGFISIDNNPNSYNNVEFGSRHGDSTSYGPDVIAFSVASEHNTTTRYNIAQFLNDKFQLFNHSSNSTSLSIAPQTGLVGMWEFYNNNTFKNNGYTYTLPNTTGTIALTSDIPSQANDVTTTDTLTANKLLLGNGNKTVKITTKELLDSGSSNSWAIVDRITDTYIPTVKSIDNNKGVCIHLPSNKTSGTTADYSIRAYNTPSEAWDRAKIIDSNNNPIYAHDYYFERGGYYYYPENFSSTTTWYWSCPVYYNGNIITKRVLSLTRSNGNWTFTSYDYSPTFTDNDSKVDQYQSGTSKALSGTKYSILTRYAQDNKNSTYDSNYARYSTDVTIDTADGTLDALIIKENGSRLTPKVSSTTDNAAVRFDGTSGTLQNSAVIITDNKQVKAHGYVIQSTSGSTTTDKAEMLYDATEECIKFVFA